MKKMLLAVSALCVVMFSVNSIAASIGVGFKGGLSLGTLTGKSVDDMNEESDLDGRMRAGFVGYGLLSMDFVKCFGGQIEVGLVGKGKKYTYEEENYEFSETIKLNYLEIPILLKGMVPLGNAKPMIYVGPTLGFMLSSKMKMHAEVPYEPVLDTTVDIEKSERNGFEFGLAFGAGSTFDVGPGAIIIDVRYTIGFTSIAKLTDEEKEFGVSEEDIETKTGTLAIMAGYQFNF